MRASSNTNVAGLQWPFNGDQICQEKCKLPFRPPVRSTPEENDRNVLLGGQCEQRAEIRVGRYQDLVLLLGAQTRWRRWPIPNRNRVHATRRDRCAATHPPGWATVHCRSEIS